jgi:hypothetical protein
MKTDYKSVKDFIGWDKAEEFIQQIIIENNIKSILELGAGANPTIHPEFIDANKLTYTISDIDFDELAKANDVYIKEVINLNTNEISHSKKYDFIFSRMVSEHISNGYYYHRNIFSLLNSGGIAFHCFSTLYSFPFLINRLFPETLSDILLKIFAPRDKHKHGKFKAYYSWCRGPSEKMIKKFEAIGYSVIEYCGYYGHNYYNKIPVLNKLEKNKAKYLIKIKISYLTSYAHIILRKM